MTAEHLAQRVAELALDRKALDVVIIDLSGRSSYTDFLVVASGTSDRHVEAVSQHVAHTLKTEDSVKLSGHEGWREGQWALSDYGDVILHVFHQFTRDVYNLEELWKDAPITPVEDAHLASAVN